MRLWPKHVILMRTRCSISMPKVISAPSLSNTLPSGLTFHSFRTSKSRPNRAFNPDAPPAWLRLRVCVHHRGVARLAGAPVNFALGVMAPNERSTLVAGWIEHHTERIELDSDNVFHRVRGKNNFWAWEQLNDLCRNQPQLAWEIVLDIFRAPHHESVDWSLAAGPLEDLLAWHGEDRAPRRRLRLGALAPLGALYRTCGRCRFWPSLGVVLHRFFAQAPCAGSQRPLSRGATVAAAAHFTHHRGYDALSSHTWRPA